MGKFGSIGAFVELGTTGATVVSAGNEGSSGADVVSVGTSGATVVSMGSDGSTGARVVSTGTSGTTTPAVVVSIGASGVTTGAVTVEDTTGRPSVVDASGAAEDSTGKAGYLLGPLVGMGVVVVVVVVVVELFSLPTNGTSVDVRMGTQTSTPSFMQRELAGHFLAPPEAYV